MLGHVGSFWVSRVGFVGHVLRRVASLYLKKEEELGT